MEVGEGEEFVFPRREGARRRRRERRIAKALVERNVVELRGRNWNIGGGGGGGGSYTRGHGINRYGQTACSTNYRSLITGGRDLSG